MIKKYDEVFLDVFNIKEDELDNLKYQSIDSWDSVGHMTLIVALETAFDIEMEMDDIIDFESYKKGIEIITKYGVEF
jgi:acyl carrier protein